MGLRRRLLSGGGLRGRGRMPGLPLAFSPPGRHGEEEMRKKVNEEAMLEQRAKEEALKNEALTSFTGSDNMD